jgi:acyl-CoA synthetase (NDP forming)
LSVPANTREGFKSPDSVLRPRNIAIIGASERAAWPRTIHGQLKSSGFKGRIFPINPRQSEVYGEKCYPDLASLPEKTEHALVIVPAPAVIDVLESSVKAGLKSCTVYAGNIGEGVIPEVVARGVALRELVDRTGLAVNGPNCMGGNSLRDRFFGYPNPDLVNLPIGNVSMVSQSGGTLQFLAQSAAARGVKFSTMFSTGNEIDLDLADFVDHLVDDEHTKVIALFIEGIRRPHVFMRAAARALAAGKPIVAIKTGKTQKSRDASMSHTGAIAGDYEVFQAMCERYGIVACDSLDDMVETLLAFEPCRWPKGNRVGWVTTSGGTVDLLFDYIEEIGGTTAPEFSDTVKSSIRHLVPAELAIKNPLDAGIPTTDANAAEMCIAVANDPGIDMLAWAQVLPSGKRSPDVDTIRTILAATDKPVVAFGRMQYMFEPKALEFQDAVGFPFLQALPPTIRALGDLAFYGARVGKKIEALHAPKGVAAAFDGDALAGALARHGVTAP